MVFMWTMAKIYNNVEGFEYSISLKLNLRACFVPFLILLVNSHRVLDKHCFRIWSFLHLDMILTM